MRAQVLLSAARRRAVGLPGELILAGGTACWLAAAAAALPQAARHWVVLTLVVLASTIALVLRRRWPLAAMAAAGAALLAVHALGAQALASPWLTPPLLWTAFAVCYALGSLAGPLPGFAAAMLFGGTLEYVNGAFSPVVWMVTAGPWLAGRVVQSRRILTAQLAERNAELEGEQELFARESVRYERARIARELHDIVSHSLSAMVVQATAAQRLADSDPDGVAEAMRAVATSAAQAEQDIGQLVELLEGEPSADQALALPMISELTQRAAAAGLDVTCRLAWPLEGLGPAASQAAYRVVQEALTNALKHAPGAAVMIAISAAREGPQAALISVTSEPARRGPSALARSGAGYGLTAMRERVSACGGSLTAGPTADGGWQVCAILPRVAQPESRCEPASRAGRASEPERHG